MIWDEALRNESKQRFIILSRAQVHRHRMAISPLKHLISPFLVANRESRARAQLFYDVKVEMHSFKIDKPVTYQELMRPLHPKEEFPRQNIVQRTRQALRRKPRISGVVYINTKYDNFVAANTSFPPPDHDIAEARVMLWGYGAYATDGGYSIGARRAGSRYMMAPLSADITRRIENLILAWQRTLVTSTLESDYLEFISGHFNKQRRFRYIDLEGDDEPGFLDYALSRQGLSVQYLNIREGKLN